MNNIGTPRIYINMPQYYLATGISKIQDYSSSDPPHPTNIMFGGSIALTTEERYSMVGLDPSKQFQFPHGQSENNPARWYTYFMPYFAFGGTGLWCGVFGHNFNSIGMYKAYIGFRPANDFGGGFQVQGACHQSDPFTAGGEFTEYDGWSIKAGDAGNFPEAGWCHITVSNHTGTSELGYEGTTLTGDLKSGSWTMGSYFDFPHSPELNLTQSIEMGGLTKQQSVIGGSISNSMQTPNMWGELGAWELGRHEYWWDPSTWVEGISTVGKIGKRVWNLSFSYLESKDTLPINALGGSIADMEDDPAGYTEGTDYYEGSLSDIFGTSGNPLGVLNGEDFFSAVWNKTLGAHLPFIFQPDKDNNNPDQFAICKFDQKSLQVKQVANHVYNIKLKIREVY